MHESHFDSRLILNAVGRFLGNFAKRAFVVTDQVRVIGDFLNASSINHNPIYYTDMLATVYSWSHAGLRGLGKCIGGGI